MLRARVIILSLGVLLFTVRGAAAQNFITLRPSPSPEVGIAPTPPTGTTMNGLVAKTTPGNLYSFIGTTGTTAGCFFVFNATSVPSTGAVTFGIASGNAVLPPIQAPASSTTIYDTAPGPPTTLTVGITIGFSSTCGGTFTQSATATIGASIQ